MRMKQTAIILISVIIALAGIFFFGRAITGYVISESCCFPPDCDPENLCANANPALESPQPIARSFLDSTGFYLLITVIAVAITVNIYRHRHKGL
jgi:hypothetical protein